MFFDILYLIKENRGSDPYLESNILNLRKTEKSFNNANKSKDFNDNPSKDLKIHNSKLNNDNDINNYLYVDILEKNIYIKNDVDNDGNF